MITWTRAAHAAGHLLASAPHEGQPSHRHWLRRAAGAAAAWVRGGYDQDAPRLGFSPLIALNGPVSLTGGQLDQVVRNFRTCGNTHPDPVDVRVAICTVTGTLPSPSQVAAVLHALGEQP
ncbi:hypothetical protein BKG83_06015 [Mycobacteroides chelonae]|uniref:Uncharacterized protein n=1 Tax=Mycobacteroides chelonae TaxID=1774 RepID=A0A1S1LYN0_MYCCH|nr:DUF3349 domain-containing protein [Mycobacteroides chelonae]PKQ57549.1 hypothetical protein B5566_12255 [Mycobacterium sp. MHSD3]SKL33946.1 Protein of uncharacterised function (DUF3349) [Mycobacteroides abscessus subsp. bolletii]MBF9523947.1 DUF3349 domain-containing protein [Mycobacteroides chelonae]OHU57271.1 hypothetical protein BKG83_06015 [Mycobacteroides chelonae]OHU75748.1 hypothetical protein BKG84_27030 [Mycobacteroides chelonae]